MFPMNPKQIANLILGFHVAISIMAFFGGFVVFLLPWFAIIHLPLALWCGIVNIADWTCPLTPLEKIYRSMAGEGKFEGGFIQNYIGPFVKIKMSPRQLELIAGFAVFLWNIPIYILIGYFVF
jgi:hypothetical protein